MLYAGITVAAIFFGYVVVRQLLPKPVVPDDQTSRIQPWYKKQSPPPSLITVPDAPLFPDTRKQRAARKQDGAAKAPRAYEEALPAKIYQTTPPAPLKVRQAPVKAAAALPPWRRYAVEIPAGKGPMIAMVIDDMGVDKIRSARVIKLQAPLTLSFMTYAGNLAGQTDRARLGGHELMLHVAMEPISRTVDPGPNVLLTGLDDNELERRLDWGLGRFSGYVGINNHMGSKFTADSRAMRLVIEAVKRRGLLFLDSRTTGRTVGAKLARRLGVPVAERNIFIDNIGTLDEINARLREVEKLARRNGFAVAIGHPRQATIEALKVWLGGLRSKGFRLVPISAIVKRFGAS